MSTPTTPNDAATDDKKKKSAKELLQNLMAENKQLKQEVTKKDIVSIFCATVRSYALEQYSN